MHQQSTISNATDEQLCRMVETSSEIPEKHRLSAAAVAELYQRYCRRLLAFLSTKVPRDEVDNFAQETWLKVCQSACTGFKGGNFCSWLFTIARNGITDSFRRRQLEVIEEVHQLADPQARLPEDVVFDAERARILGRCLERLGKFEGLIIRARLQGDDYDEICRRLNVQSADAHRICHRAKTQLQQCVGQDEL